MPPTMPMPMEAFFTVGHSNRSLPEFIDVLRSADIETLADVRRFPASRRHPHFNFGPLREGLATASIAYRHLPQLGGYREPPDTQPSSLNDGWPYGFLRNYADYAMTPSFQAALDDLRQMSKSRTVVMCAERRWTECHRQIIADYLIVKGYRIIHLIDSNTCEDGRLTRFAMHDESGKIEYPSSRAQLQFDL